MELVCVWGEYEAEMCCGGGMSVKDSSTSTPMVGVKKRTHRHALFAPQKTAHWPDVGGVFAAKIPLK